jgi:hypothetical protein
LRRLGVVIVIENNFSLAAKHQFHGRTRLDIPWWQKRGTTDLLAVTFKAASTSCVVLVRVRW